MKILLFVLVLVFAIFGFCEALHTLKLFLIFPKRKTNSVLVLVLNPNTAELQITYAGEQFKWLGSKLANRVIAVIDNSDSELLKNCMVLAEKYGIKLVVKGKG